VKLVISDAHEGIKASVARVLNTTWQRCRVHFQRNALAHAGKSSRRVVSAFAQPDHATAKTQWRNVADQMRGKLPRLSGLMERAFVRHWSEDNGERRRGRARLHDLSPSASDQIAFDESD
tara:strand:+ start:2653 stop:3012 length:360 start_codon:yes stop_codon:yes gene_type:complete